MAVWNNHGYLFTGQIPQSTFNECSMCGESTRAALTFITVWKTFPHSFLQTFASSSRFAGKTRRWVSDCLSPPVTSLLHNESPAVCHWYWILISPGSSLLVESEWRLPRDEHLVCRYVTGCSIRRNCNSGPNKVISRDQSSDTDMFSKATLQSLLPFENKELVKVLLLLPVYF